MVLIRNFFEIVLNFIKLCYKNWDANLKNRFGNKSAFLCTTLEHIANKIDQYLIKLKLLSMLSIYPVLKLSPISADKPWDEI